MQSPQNMVLFCEYMRIVTLLIVEGIYWIEQPKEKMAHADNLICDYINTGSNSKMFNSRIRDRICEMSRTLAGAETTEEFMADMVQFYKDFGVGKLGLNKAFRIEHGKDGKPVITPILSLIHI